MLKKCEILNFLTKKQGCISKKCILAENFRKVI